VAAKPLVTAHISKRGPVAAKLLNANTVAAPH
jgi:hypothetical protein